MNIRAQQTCKKPGIYLAICGIAVYDMAGNLVLSSNGNSANTDNLYPGVYAVRAKGFSRKITVKANK